MFFSEYMSLICQYAVIISYILSSFNASSKGVQLRGLKFSLTGKVCQVPVGRLPLLFLLICIMQQLF